MAWHRQVLGQIFLYIAKFLCVKSHWTALLLEAATLDSAIAVKTVLGRIWDCVLSFSHELMSLGFTNELVVVPKPT